MRALLILLLVFGAAFADYPNTTNITSGQITSASGLLRVANDVTDGLFGISVSFIIWIVIAWTVFARSGELRLTIVASSAMSFLTNLFMYLYELLPDKIVALPLIILGLSVFIPRQ